MIKCNNIQEQASDLSELIFERWRHILAIGDFSDDDVEKIVKWIRLFR
jgi:dTDP-3-amino-2,3,6-trideoxy-4-keto-D-glucose/dTDP-3-amino-3,4,6-trideoxy-alpha-D-glucose/dTDP-2,6-dideoxy-D-kanosamine transaminase